MTGAGLRAWSRAKGLISGVLQASVLETVFSELFLSTGLTFEKYKVTADSFIIDNTSRGQIRTTRFSDRNKGFGSYLLAMAFQPQLPGLWNTSSPVSL